VTTLACPTTFGHAKGTGSVILRFDDSNPFEVRLDFVGKDGVVTWTVARDLLAQGLTGLTGLLDFRCWTEDPWFCVTLSSPADGRATLRLPAGIVRAFLAGTEALVPFGAEAVDFDAELSRLLIGDW
jgi:Streptomyces sporulation and cell division protein, SsgA